MDNEFDNIKNSIDANSLPATSKADTENATVGTNENSADDISKTNNWWTKIANIESVLGLPPTLGYGVIITVVGIASYLTWRRFKKK